MQLLLVRTLYRVQVTSRVESITMLELCEGSIIYSWTAAIQGLHVMSSSITICHILEGRLMQDTIHVCSTKYLANLSTHFLL